MTGVEGRTVLVLGGGGMVGTAVCRELAGQNPARVAVAARREASARRAAKAVAAAHPGMAGRVAPVWGDVFLRAEWSGLGDDARGAVIGDRAMRRLAIGDMLAPLDDAILEASLLNRMIMGRAPALDDKPAEIVIDCMNTATAVGYQDVYGLAQRLMGLAERGGADWPAEVETLIAALSVPQLVRHVQILYAAMRAAGTRAYVKIGTSGTGGMGFNIPYTHGEERPSRLLLSKAALAGAQTMLTFLMARTPDAPPLVREIKPTALIGWHEIGHGPIRRRGRPIPLVDCALADAVALDRPGSLAPEGPFGTATGGMLEGVYVDTGENGLFSADEFAAITSLGQMQLITPEEIARTVAMELNGTTTGRDVIGALDGAVSGPTYRGGVLRQTALARLRELEARHGRAVAFEVLGPPRLSKLLFEAHLLEAATGDLAAALATPAEELSAALLRLVEADAGLRRRMLSIGIPVLLPDGARLLRGPVIKAVNAHDGWVDLTPANMARWRERLAQIATEAEAERSGFPTPGEIVGWIFRGEDAGLRWKS